MKTAPDRVYVIVRANPAEGDQMEYWSRVWTGGWRWEVSPSSAAFVIDPQMCGIVLRQARKTDPGAYVLTYVNDGVKIKVVDD